MTKERRQVDPRPSRREHRSELKEEAIQLAVQSELHRHRRNALSHFRALKLEMSNNEDAISIQMLEDSMRPNFCIVDVRYDDIETEVFNRLRDVRLAIIHNGG